MRRRGISCSGKSNAAPAACYAEICSAYFQPDGWSWQHLLKRETPRSCSKIAPRSWTFALSLRNLYEQDDESVFKNKRTIGCFRRKRIIKLRKWQKSERALQSPVHPEVSVHTSIKLVYPLPACDLVGWDCGNSSWHTVRKSKNAFQTFFSISPAFFEFFPDLSVFWLFSKQFFFHAFRTGKCFRDFNRLWKPAEDSATPSTQTDKNVFSQERTEMCPLDLREPSALTRILALSWSETTKQRRSWTSARDGSTVGTGQSLIFLQAVHI